MLLATRLSRPPAEPRLMRPQVRDRKALRQRAASTGARNCSRRLGRRCRGRHGFGQWAQRGSTAASAGIAAGTSAASAGAASAALPRQAVFRRAPHRQFGQRGSDFCRFIGSIRSPPQLRPQARPPGAFPRTASSLCGPGAGSGSVLGCGCGGLCRCGHCLRFGKGQAERFRHRNNCSTCRYTVCGLFIRLRGEGNRGDRPARYETHQLGSHADNRIGFAPHLDCHSQAGNSLVWKVHFWSYRCLGLDALTQKNPSITLHPTTCRLAL